MLETTLFGIAIVEWIGYLASIVVLISLSMTSIIKLRWINLVGSFIFASYGFLIGSMPVGIMNTLVVFANIYNIYKIYSKKEDFKILPISVEDNLLKEYLNHYSEDIRNYAPNLKLDGDMISFLILRDMTISGIFIASKQNEMLKIELDYALPPSRDYQIGKYMYNELPNIKEFSNIKKLYFENNKDYKYLQKMGFTSSEYKNETVMIKNI